MLYFLYERERRMLENIFVLQCGLASILLCTPLFNRFAKNRSCRSRASPKIRLAQAPLLHVEYRSFRSLIVRTRRDDPIARNLSDEIKAWGYRRSQSAMYSC